MVGREESAGNFKADEDMAERKLDIAIIGTGNVACHYAGLLKDKANIRYVAGRNLEAAQKIARETGGSTQAYSLFDELPSDVDTIIIAVSDDAISEVSRQLPQGPVLIHTSGSRSLDALGTERKRGVVYPLQTFSKDREIARGFPVFIEASDKATQELVEKIARMISNDVTRLDSTQRMRLHIGGVMVCNFVNYLLGSAYSVMDSASIDFKYLRPLAEETIAKAFSGSNPFDIQTVTARRVDSKTIQLHESELNGEEREIYSFMSEKIKRKFKK